MSAILQEVKAYYEELRQRKGRLALALLVFLGLFMVSIRYSYNGINRHFLNFTFLCLITGALLVCPRLKKWYLTWPTILLYIILIPQKMFQRIELPVHDMSRIQPGAKFANVLIILLVYAIFLLIFQHIRFALGGGVLLF